MAEKLAKWSQSAWRMLAEVEAEKRERQGPRVDLATALSEPDPVIRAALLRAVGIDVESTAEEQQ